jgi:enamine deaminase RidA (YjgF/YER057c/UK114 family)
VGNVIEVAGTTAVDETSVVRTRMFVTDISRWEEIARAHGKVFREIKPASTMVEVKALISPELLVEIEASAILED